MHVYVIHAIYKNLSGRGRRAKNTSRKGCRVKKLCRGTRESLKKLCTRKEIMQRH